MLKLIGGEVWKLIGYVEAEGRVVIAGESEYDKLSVEVYEALNGGDEEVAYEAYSPNVFTCQTGAEPCGRLRIYALMAVGEDGEEVPVKLLIDISGVEDEENGMFPTSEDIANA